MQLTPKIPKATIAIFPHALVGSLLFIELNKGSIIAIAICNGNSNMQQVAKMVELMN